MTLSLGLASVFMINGSLYNPDEIKVNLPQVKSSKVLEVTTSDKTVFAMVGQGCGLENEYGGRGSGTSYQDSFSGRVFVESSCHDRAKKTKKELDLRIRNAVKVLEFQENLNRNEEWKTRVVLLTDKESGAVEILRYNAEKCISIISAPRLKTALEMEKFLRK